MPLLARTRLRLLPFRSHHLRHHYRLMSAAPAFPDIPLFRALAKHDPQSPAVIHSSTGQTYTYSQLLSDVFRLKESLIPRRPANAIRTQQTIALLIGNSYEFVVSLLCVLARNEIVLPLCIAHPPAEMEHVLGLAEPVRLLASPRFKNKAAKVYPRPGAVHVMPEIPPSTDITAEPERLIRWDSIAMTSQGALVIPTSGTTSRPKATLSSTRALTHQLFMLSELWGVTPKDRLLHMLPLHHIHGLVVAMLMPLFAGAAVEFEFPFKPDYAWRRMGSGEITVFMGVPTMYSRLLDAVPQDRGNLKQGLRLAVSGSAPTLESVSQRWNKVTGVALLDRYGMTEAGMISSQRLDERPEGSVGWPLPGVKCRVDEATDELEVRGPNLFSKYLKNQEKTQEAFTQDGWFKTGDVVQLGSLGEIFIRGRASADIIKSGGEKISALEVEKEILKLKGVKEVAVLGITDKAWGERVAALVVMKDGAKWPGDRRARELLKEKLAAYKVPKEFRLVSEVERNIMGKVAKKATVAELWDERGEWRGKEVRNEVKGETRRAR